MLPLRIISSPGATTYSARALKYVILPDIFYRDQPLTEAGPLDSEKSLATTCCILHDRSRQKTSLCAQSFGAYPRDMACDAARAPRVHGSDKRTPDRITLGTTKACYEHAGSLAGKGRLGEVVPVVQYLILCRLCMTKFRAR